LAFQKRFRDVRSDQYRFPKLQTVRHAKSKTFQEFADRCRILAHHTIPTTDDPRIRKIYQEQAKRMILTSFSAGLSENPGKQVRYLMPKRIEEAVQLAVTVAQAELQKRRNKTFLLEAPTLHFTLAGRPLGSAQNPANLCRPSQQTNSVAKPDRGRHRTRNRQPSCDRDRTEATLRCYECDGIGHFARVCPTRKNRQNSTNTNSKQGGLPNPSIQNTRRRIGDREPYKHSEN
jgi:hypothetical protein